MTPKLSSPSASCIPKAKASPKTTPKR
jgi:hypothetical protein